MNDSGEIKNRTPNELINFQEELVKLRESCAKLPAEPIKNSLNWRDHDTPSSLAIELAAFGVWDWDLRANKIYFPPRWKEVLGYPDSEIGDAPEEWFERIHPNDLKSVLTSLTQLLAGESVSFSSEHRILGKDQIFKWILSEGNVTARDESGNPVRLTGINTDITQRKKMEFALRERLKELNCHNQMSEIMSNSNLTAEQVINQIVRIIPGSWQFPEIAQASVTINDKIFATSENQISTFSLSHEIKAGGKVIGEVTVFYPEGQELDAEQVFLPEESLLLFSIAVRIGNFVDTKEKDFTLLKNELRYSDIIGNINDVIFEIDNQGFITFISSPVFKIFGYTAEEITGQNFIHFVGENGQALLQRLSELSKKVELMNEYQIRTKAGESRWIQMSTRAILSDGNFKGGTGTIIDITQRKLIEIELQKSESLYRSVLNASPDTITITNLEGVILYSSPRILKMFRYTDTNAIINKSLFDFIDESDHYRVRVNIEKLFQGTLLRAEEYTGIRSDGTLFNIEVNAEFIRDPKGNPINMLFVTRDISERKQAEEKLLKSEEKYRNLVERLNDVVYEITNESIIKYVSPSIEQIVGYTPDELFGKDIFEFIHPDDVSLVAEILSKLGSRDIPYLEYRYLTKSGRIAWVRTSTTPIYENGRVIGGTGSLTDITDRKLAEEKIEKLNRLYSVISHVSQAIVHVRDKSELLDEVCSIAIEHGKFRMAWIGMIDDETKIVKPVVIKGYEEGYLSVIIPISVSDIPEGRGPTGTAIRNGDHFVCANIETDPIVAPWRGEALKRGYHSSIALPLKQSGKIVGAFTLYSSLPSFFDQEEIQLLDEFVNEISFALETIETENERQKPEIQLRRLYRAVEQSPVSIVIADLEGNIEYANPKASATTGYAFDELIGKNPRVLKSGETPEAEYQELWADITAGKEWRGIFHNKRKSGELYWESSTISPITDYQGKITHFLAVKEDITEQKIAEQELRLSEERYKVLFENYHTVMMTIDPETGEIKNANPAACNYYGWSLSEMCAKKIWDINTADPGEMKVSMQQALNKQLNRFDYKHKLRNGEIRDVEVFSNPVQIRESKLLFAIVNDITKRKLAEQEIIKFRTIADQANYGSAITSLDGQILYINAAFAHMHGYEPDDLSEKNLGVFHNEEQLPRVFELLNQLKITGSFSAQEVGHTRKDGSVFPTLMNASLILDQNNIPQFMSATVIDITELKEKEKELQRSENELNNAQELAQLGSWEHDLITGKLTGSKNYYRMIGLQPGEKIDNLYEYFISLVHPEDLPLIELLQKHQYHDNDMQVVDVRIIVPGAGLRWIQNNVVPVFENNQMVALRGGNIDITEKKKILEDLIKAKEKAEESDNLKTSFLNNISHEIRTPFSGILGFLSILQYDDLTSDERDEYIGAINQSADRLMNTINDIVDLSQIQSGLMKLNPSITDIRNLVEEVVDRFKREAELNGLKFNVSYEFTGSGENFSTDSKKLNTILFHLIGNAIKFTKSGSIDFSVRGNDSNIEFCVKDTGIGISKDKQQIVFSRFIQADYSNTRKFEGSGLGLTIAKAFVEMLNGELWMESEEGVGSEFHFNIPNNNKLLSGRENMAPEHPLPDTSVKKLKILIAEDDEGSAIFLSIIVKPFSKEILKVKPGLEAIEACRNNPDLDLILMDIRMPVMDGYEATRQIRKFNPDVVIIAQTAFALTGDDEKSLEAGCNDYISKPIHKDKLQMLIQNFFH